MGILRRFERSVESISYMNLSVKPDQLLENFLYESDSENDEEETD